MTDLDRDAGGQFVTKVVESGKTKGKGSPLKEKGHKKYGGRQKGTPNKAGREFKAACDEFLKDPQVQQALLDKMRGGNTDSIFRASDRAFGKPKETVESTVELRMFVWPDDSDVD